MVVLGGGAVSYEVPLYALGHLAVPSAPVGAFLVHAPGPRQRQRLFPVINSLSLSSYTKVYSVVYDSGSVPSKSRLLSS